jgi:isopentenyldiphosphate isomerase
MRHFFGLPDATQWRGLDRGSQILFYDFQRHCTSKIRFDDSWTDSVYSNPKSPIFDGSNLGKTGNSVFRRGILER